MAGKRRNPKHPIDRGVPASIIADKFGGGVALAAALNRPASTVQRWIMRGHIDGKYHDDIMGAARAKAVRLKPADFVDTRPAEARGAHAETATA